MQPANRLQNYILQCFNISFECLLWARVKTLLMFKAAGSKASTDCSTCTHQVLTPCLHLLT